MSQEKSLTWLSEYKVPLFFAILGIVFFFVGFYTLSQSSHTERGVFLDKQSTKAAEASSSAHKNEAITVDIEGAVATPGVYTMQKGDRVQDVLVKAGGLATHANKDVIAKQLNMAKKIVDGEKIYIPSIQDLPSNIEGASTTNQDLININSASSAELETLSGIGQATSQKIIKARPFSTIDELLTKKLVSSKVFEQIKERIIAQ